MTKFYFFILACFCICSARAQYTITSASNPVPGDIEIYKKVDSTGLQLGSGGTGQTWNYTAAVIITTASPTSGTYIPTSSVPNISLFPGANIGKDNGSGSYSVYNNNSTKIDYIGAASSNTTNCIYYSNSIVMLPLPFSYGSNNVDLFNGASPIYTISGTFTATGHGSGTLMLPTGTYGNVLKVRQSYLQILVMTTSTLNINVIQDSYYSAINKFPLFSVGTQTITTITTSTSVSYNKGGSINSALITSIDDSENALAEFNIFPNPAHDKVNLWFTLNADGNYELSINNLLGQSLRNVSYDNLKSGLNSLTADLNGLPCGIYYMKLKGKDGETTKKLIIE